MDSVLTWLGWIYGAAAFLAALMVLQLVILWRILEPTEGGEDE